MHSILIPTFLNNKQLVSKAYVTIILQSSILKHVVIPIGQYIQIINKSRQNIVKIGLDMQYSKRWS